MNLEIDLSKFEAFCVQLEAAVDPRKDGANPPPWGYPNEITVAMLAEHLDEAAVHLPVAYRDAYFKPLRTSLDHLLVSHDQPAEVALLAETLAGAVCQHSKGYPLQKQLRQFLAVVSNYYRSFLSKAKRTAVGAPLVVSKLPPLAVFRHRGKPGPFTLPGDVVQRLCGVEVGVVCLPENYAVDPVTWLTLAHETAGHDVLHADPTLLPDLVSGVRTIFGGGPVRPGEDPDEDQIQALLWGYWVDEVASDVYAILNAGPAFVYNLAAFLAAFRGGPKQLSVDANSNSRWNELDPHPPDVLRLHAAIGVIENLTGLDPGDRKGHVANIRKLAKLGTAAQRTLKVTGRVEIERDHWVDLEDASIPFLAAAESARRVGAYIATARLQAFGQRSVQDIETWDAADDYIAGRIAQAFREKDADRVKILGDDAQLLAGATLALLDNPEAYRDVNDMLADALTLSFQTDPVVGFPLYHRMLDTDSAKPPDSGEVDDARDKAHKPPPAPPTNGPAADTASPPSNIQ